MDPYHYYLGESARRLATIKEIDFRESPPRNHHIGFFDCSEYQHSGMKEEGEDWKAEERVKYLL